MRNGRGRARGSAPQIIESILRKVGLLGKDSLLAARNRPPFIPWDGLLALHLLRIGFALASHLIGLYFLCVSMKNETVPRIAERGSFHDDICGLCSIGKRCRLGAVAFPCAARECMIH